MTGKRRIKDDLSWFTRRRQAALVEPKIKGYGDPTPERGQHSEVIEAESLLAGQPAARIALSPLERYGRRKLITARQLKAGERLRDAHDLGVVGAHDPEMGVGGGGGVAGYSDLRLDECALFAQATQALGPRLYPLVVAVCCHEITVEVWAESRQLDRRHAMGQFKIGLDQLGDFMGFDEEIVRETVDELPDMARGTFPAFVLVFRHEADGTVTGLTLNSQPWDESASNPGMLKKRAAQYLDLTSGRSCV